ncbi:MAG TPA: hypothetical protein VK762_21140 [Polyangiaceae bacterium]|nr:hypothetical protein [Polyangiaceae bacterium]
MATKRDTKSQVAADAKQLIAATAKHLTSGTQVPLLGGSFTPDQVTSKLQMLVDLRSDVDASRASTKAKIANETAQMPALRTFKSAYRTYIKAAFGSSPDVLADFGITPKAREPLTVEAKAAAAAKRASTRAARHTMGSDQKKAIKGDVTGVLVTPITVPPSVTPVPATSGPTTPATSGGPTAASTPTTPATSTGPTVAATPHTA